MPVSYSAPRPGQINTFERIDQTNRMQGSRGVESRVTSNGPLMDFRNPSQAGQNELQKAAPLAEFIKTVGELGSTMAQAYTTERMSLRAGEIMSDPAVMELIQQGGPEAKSKLFGLTKEFQDQIVGNAAASLVPKLQEELQINIARSQNLNDRSWLAKEYDPLAWSEEFRAVAPKGLEQLNALVRLNPNATQSAVLGYQNFQGQIRAGLRGKAFETRREVGYEQLGQSVADVARKAATDLDTMQLLGSGDTALSVEAQQAVDGQTGKILSTVREYAGKFGLTPEGYLTRAITDAESQLSTLVKEAENREGESDLNDIVDARRKLALLVLAMEKLGGPGESAIYARGENGTRPIDAVRALYARTGGQIIELEKRNSVQIGARVALETELTDAPPEQVLKETVMPIINEMMANGNNVGALNVYEFYKRGRDSKISYSEQQQETLQRGWTSDALNELVREGSVSQETINRGLEIPGNGTNVQGVLRQKASFDEQKKRRVAEPLADQLSALSIASDIGEIRRRVNAGVTGGKLQKPPAGEEWIPKEGLEKEYSERVFGEAMKIALQLDEQRQGKPLNEKELAAVMETARRNVVENYVKRVPAVKGGDQPALPDPGAQSKAEINNLLSRVKARGGRLEVNDLPTWVRDSLKKQNRQNSRGASMQGLRMFADSLEGVKLPDGKPLIDTGGSSVYDWLRKQIMAGTEKVSSVGPINNIVAVNRSLEGLQRYGLTGEDMGFSTAKMTTKGDTLASTGTEVVTDAVTTAAPPVEDREAQGQVVADKLGRAVLDMAGVKPTAPSPEGPIPIQVIPLNATPEGLKTLGRLGTGREQMRADTPPLPQAPFDAPTERLPLAVTSSKHPWLYAMALSRQAAVQRRGGQPLLMPEYMKGGRMTALEGSGPVERVTSLSYEGPRGQGGIDVYFESKRFPAVLPGVVKDVGWEPGYGNFVVVESSDPKTGAKVDVLYGHLGDSRGQGVSVKEGQQVGAGAIIGRQGSTGNVQSVDGTIASIDFLAPAPKGSGSMAKYSRYQGLRVEIGSALQKGQLVGGPAPAAPAAARRPAAPVLPGGAGPADMRTGLQAIQQAGFPRRGAAWLAGNIQQESSWRGARTWADPGDGNRTGGLVSWNGGRLKKIEEKYLGKPISQATAEEQLNAMIREMRAEYPKAWDVFMNPNATEAQLIRASKIYWGYGHEGKRYDYARELLR
jgi:murein DD-endopeptidase MepM/ murein hydrolase activator NlpD